MAAKQRPISSSRAGSRRIESTDENRNFSPEEFRYYSESKKGNSTYAHVNLLQSKVEVPAESVRSCLNEMAKDHYMLHAKVVTKPNGEISYSKMESIDHEGDWIPLEFHSTKVTFAWRDLVRESFQKPLDYTNGPMWRALWVSCPSGEPGSFFYMLIIIICHAVIDGKAAVDLCANQFLRRLNSAMKGETMESETRPIYFTEPVEVIFGNAESGVGVSDYPKPWYIKLLVKSLLFWKRKEKILILIFLVFVV